MRQERNQSYDQKKGSADQCATGQKRGMDGGSIGRGEMSMGSGSSSGQSRNAGSGRSDHGGSEGNSRERKTARNGSDSSES